MKYKKDDDNRYRIRFMRSTEELMDAMTVKEFVSYLDENAELEDEADYEYIDGKAVKCKAYDLKEADSSLHKEFLVTEDGRLFYWLSLLQKVELVDREEKKEVLEMRYPVSKSKCSKCSACCLVTKDISFAPLDESEMYYQCLSNSEDLCGYVDIRECQCCGKLVERSEMDFTRDCHGIPFRLVCFDCYEKLMAEGYDGELYDETDECLDDLDEYW